MDASFFLFLHKNENVVGTHKKSPAKDTHLNDENIKYMPKPVLLR